MAKKTTGRKKKTSENSMGKIVIIVAVLAILSVVIAWFLMNKDEQDNLLPDVFKTDNNLNENKNQPTETKLIKTLLDGTWVSNYDGSMLTIENGKFTIETPAVDAGNKYHGFISVENTVVSFIWDTDSKLCPANEAHYSFSFENDELKLSKVKENCKTAEKKLTSSTWFRL